jgi:iron-sulfur cluster assembly protein
MALDDPSENDEIIKDNGVTYLIDKMLLEQAKPISVDFVETETGSGFSISSSLPKGDGCSSCSSCS